MSNPLDLIVPHLAHALVPDLDLDIMKVIDMGAVTGTMVMIVIVVVEGAVVEVVVKDAVAIKNIIEYKTNLINHFLIIKALKNFHFNCRYD